MKPTFEIRFEHKGRKVSLDQLFGAIDKEGRKLATAALEQMAHGKAASIVDPATEKHPPVFVQPIGDGGVALHTKASETYAVELERRLGVGRGTMKDGAPAATDAPRIYLAHASQDHETLARPLAKKLLAAGIDVWLDEWEIHTGDSLRRKMEEGLAGCTHFVALLTPNSIGKPWVEEEIDAGFVKAVDGRGRFLGLRVGTAITQLSPFLRARRCPEIDPESNEDVEALIADILGVSSKPPLGDKPRYVQHKPLGLESWSKSAIEVAKFLVTKSENGERADRRSRRAEITEETGLPDDDVRIGVLDLSEAGYVGIDKWNPSEFWPTLALFAEFDRYFLEFDNRKDAVAIANRLLSDGIEQVTVRSDLAPLFPDWSVRRMNSALAYLREARLVEADEGMGQMPWNTRGLYVTDRTRRFVRDHG